MMGVGKSTLGKIVAKKVGLKFIDTDANIEKNCLMKISEIFKKKGEEFFAAALTIVGPPISIFSIICFAFLVFKTIFWNG